MEETMGATTEETMVATMEATMEETMGETMVATMEATTEETMVVQGSLLMAMIATVDAEAAIF